MALDLGGRGSKPWALRPVMNVTPLVDVVLVLLIIFMVITPMLNRQFFLHVPEKKRDIDLPLAELDPPLVLELRSGGLLEINETPVLEPELEQKLERILAARSDRTLFFRAADDVPYGHAMSILDRARGAGAVSIAVLTEAR